jgi:hypothetical protein
MKKQTKKQREQAEILRKEQESRKNRNGVFGSIY